MALAGGIYSYVSNLSMHVYNSAGINFIRSPMQTLLLVGYVGVFISMRNRLLKFLLFIFVLIILATLGGRASIGLLLFMLVLARYYFMGKNDKLISGRNALIFIGFSVFMMAYVQYRSSDGFDFNFNKESIQEDIFRRLTILDRQIVSIGYFSDHPLWEGAIYATVSTAMIPRGLYPDKPPVDTGVYLYGISQGYEVSPPLPALMTFRTSWPDGYLAGYNSFGIVGVVFLSLLSGLFFGLIYNSFQKFPNLFNFYLYSSL
ncbi:MAG: oligosaccharide repeat unit polymerase, partial [Chitinophagales bacterium]|nr:oligosaccharide repeat unit polymerase [Chitinophagales bacterium]